MRVPLLTRYALMSFVAHAQSLEPLNRELPNWLQFSGEYRARLEGFSGRSYQPEDDDPYLLSRWRLNIRLQPLKWMKVFAQTQDARVFWNTRIPDAPPYLDYADLRLAWVELGDSKSGRLALTIGRQEINLGEERLLGSSNWLNTARSFDAVRVTGRLRNIRMDIFAASVVAQFPDSFNRHLQGDNLHGIMGSVEIRKTRLEPFVL